MIDSCPNQNEDIFILDVAPIYQGYIADIGYTHSLGKNPALEKVKSCLSHFRNRIPELFSGKLTGSQAWKVIDDEIRGYGYLNIHKKYPFSVLGHRVHETNERFSKIKFLNFGWQSYWTLLSRGLFGQLLNGDFEGDLKGLWAIEPHLGTKYFGAKFEEILVVDEKGATWLEDKPQYNGSFV